MKIDHYESARRGLVPVTKILSSTYCIIVIAIYVVIVVNRFTQTPPQSHHDVEVSHQSPSSGHHFIPAVLSVHLPDGCLLHVPPLPPHVPHQAAPLSPEQEVSRQRLPQTGSSRLRSRVSPLLHLAPHHSLPGYRMLWRGRHSQDCRGDFDNLSVHVAGELHNIMER